MVHIESPQSGRVQLQVVGKNSESSTLVAQRWDDVISKHFPLNHAVVKGNPLIDSPVIGEGGRGKVYDIKDRIIKKNLTIVIIQLLQKNYLKQNLIK